LEIANEVIKKKIYPDVKYLKNTAARYAMKEYPEYFGGWDDRQWSFYFKNSIQSKVSLFYLNQFQ